MKARRVILWSIAIIPGLLVVAGLIAGWPGLVVGFCWSTVVLWHATFTINSLAHVWGRRAYETTDTSRNNAVLAVITGGEGWHNNHHRYPNSARAGFLERGYRADGPHPNQAPLRVTADLYR